MKGYELAGTIALVMIVFLAAACLVGMSNNDEGRIDCEYDVSSYIWTDSGYKRYAPSGYEYVIAHIAVANDSLSGGISTNPWDWVLQASGLVYEHDSSTFSYEKYKETVYVMPGYTYSFYIVFLIEKGSTSAGIGYCGEGTLEWDDSLIP